MGMYKYVRDLWKRPSDKILQLMHERLIAWRKEPATIRIERPTRIDRARSLGYKAKQGYIMVRQRLDRGGRRRPRDMGGRRPKHSGTRVDLDKSYQQVAEERASRKYVNCEVLNSYLVAKDGRNVWFEIILVDRAAPEIVADKRINWISTEKGRVFHGKTSAGRKSRGLLNKGKGAEKLRPSRKANIKRRQ